MVYAVYLQDGGAGVPGAGWQGGDSSGVLTVTLATPAPAGECSSQPSPA